MTKSPNHDLQWRHPFSTDLNVLILLEITASVYALIPFAHALQMHSKYYLDNVKTIL